MDAPRYLPAPPASPTPWRPRLAPLVPYLRWLILPLVPFVRGPALVGLWFARMFFWLLGFGALASFGLGRPELSVVYLFSAGLGLMAAKNLRVRMG